MRHISLLVVCAVTSLSVLVSGQRPVTEYVPIGGLLPHHIPSSWKIVQQPEQSSLVDFHIQLPTCNIEKMEKLLLEEISNPQHPNYASYLTAQQVEEMSSCGPESVEHVLEWLQESEIPAEHIFPRLTHVRVETDASRIERLFGVQIAHFEHKSSGKKVARATGLLHIPADLKEHVHFISGLTELHDFSFQPTMTESTSAPVYSRRSNALVTPNVLRRLYNVRADLLGGLSDSNSQGIAAFDDWYYEDDLCTVHQLLAPVPQTGPNLFNPPQISYSGPPTGQENGESDLDTQYMTMMAPKAQTLFYNHASGTWILGWAQQAINLTSTTGPWVWSISYGWPEMAECDSVLSITLCKALGLNWDTYIQRTNEELMKLGLMGVSVVVSSGDDGSPGFSITCPVDPAQSTSFTDEAHIPCPLDDPTLCKCGSIIISRNIEGRVKNCFFPQALTWDGAPLVDRAYGADCDFSDDLSNKLLNEAISKLSDDRQCKNFFNADYMTFASTCQCPHITTVTSSYRSRRTHRTSSITISGYQFSSSYAKSPFASDFPAASPYVLSVGATLLKPDLTNECGSTTEEVVTTSKLRSFDAGGGFSILSPRPAWQDSAVHRYLSQPGLAPSTGLFNCSNRGYPDVALNGHNYVVVINRTADRIGGTSASAPAFAAMISLMNDVLLANGKKTLGFLPPLIYEMAQTTPSTFNKIGPQRFTLPEWWLKETGGRIKEVVAGDNACTRWFCCEYSYKSSSSGWDPVSGWGTPNMKEIENYIRSLHRLPEI